jgi:heme/copper-type cytochrome/quinol oxidase subunit 4
MNNYVENGFDGNNRRKKEPIVSLTVSFLCISVLLSVIGFDPWNVGIWVSEHTNLATVSTFVKINPDLSYLYGYVPVMLVISVIIFIANIIHMWNKFDGFLYLCSKHTNLENMSYVLCGLIISVVCVYASIYGFSNSNSATLKIRAMMNLITGSRFNVSIFYFLMFSSFNIFGAFTVVTAVAAFKSRR